MTWQNDSSYSRHEFSSRATTPSSSSFASNFFRRARRASLTRNSRKCVSFADPLEAETSKDSSSENGQVLFMADSKRPPHPQRPVLQRRSLSTMSNSSLGTLGENWDSEINSDIDSEAEEVSWNIINKEVLEWQYVCRTGRPFWWSPEFKSSRMPTLSPENLREVSTRAWLRGITGDSRPHLKKRYHTMDDSNFRNSSDVQELAKVIAVQLLGSCFTLAPEYLLPLPSSPTSYNRKGDTKLPDSRMISSLRMHTQFRYSPCFGHQARSTSPIQPWDCGGYDGSSAYSSSPPGTSGVVTPQIITSEPTRRRSRLKKAHRALHVSEQSANDCNFGSHRSDYFMSGSSTFDDNAAASMGQKLRNGHASECGKASNTLHVSGADSRRHKSRPSVTRDQPQAVQVAEADDANIDTMKTYRGVRPTLPPRTNYRLQPVLRSEPHPVFVQPVRELVVKRWKSIRRQFGGSLQNSLPTRAFGNVESDSESDATSSALSTDARARRRRAQERGDIHSAGGDDSPRYNTPRSGTMTPITPMTPMSPFMIPATPPATPMVPSLPGLRPVSPFFRGADTMTAVTSFQADACQAEHIINPPDSFKDTGGYVSPNMIRTEHAAGAMFIQSRSNSQPPLEPIVDPYRVRRTSMLSEVCIPGDFNDDGTLKIDEEKQYQGPQLARANSSGTQIFRPNSDGIELDGMPVGPGKEFWDGPVDNSGKRRERTYL
ncbi:bdcc9bbe-d7d1-4b57-bf5d-8cbe8a849b86-CDS [Sclerotinia trifoliorum]|uniref:Bdcc9bbe-d7d1-4b57-bf5d-8cbe8a849b86-CDS n=1 Tax=Sclerotinia trifoliorum TaxID=28548 RepID=A0A8H2ZN88_9HELO|nr:bdcc9bbe-d7d1-4b57-bf5d-8cbe8a849b86-CDS [Sclerotinia trifoliorum]